MVSPRAIVTLFAVLVSVVMVSQAHAYTAWGFAGDDLWFACSKAKNLATRTATRACIRAGKSLGQALYSDCYDYAYRSNDGRSGIVTYYTDHYGVRVDIEYSCR